MSLFPAFFGARKRKQEPEQEQPAPLEPAPEFEDDPDALPVFELLPPQAIDIEDALPVPPQPVEEPPPQGRNVHTIGIHDLTRLSIDNDGRLYWDGKPVEVNRRLMMSRRQIIAASVVSAFIVIGAIGATLQGAAATRDWACRLGWISKHCGPPLHSVTDIPA